jgi:hypothetical protein
VLSEYAYIHPVPGNANGPVPLQGTCATTGVFNPATGASDLIDSVGACSLLDGRARF